AAKRPGSTWPGGRDQRRPLVRAVRRWRPDRRVAHNRPRSSQGGARHRPDDAVNMLVAKIAAARAVGELARRAGRGGGTSLPGKVLMRLEPHAIGELAARLPRGSVVLSATNGKTTTAAMVASILERDGGSVAHHRAG